MSDKKSTNNKTPAGDNPPPPPPVPEYRAPDRQDRNATRKQDANNSDGQTDKMVWWTRMLVILTGLLVIAGMLTWCEMHQGGILAAKQEKVAESQIRPYLQITVRSDINLAVGKSPIIAVHVANGSQTAANDVDTVSAIGVFPDPLDYNLIANMPVDSAADFLINLSPGSSSNIGVIYPYKITKAQFAALHNIFAFYIVARTTYRDVLGNVHHSYICHLWKLNASDHPITRICNTGVEDD